MMDPATASPRATPDAPGASSWRALLAYAGPFCLFVLLIGLPGLLRPGTPLADTPLWRAAPELWVYPLQTLLCAGMLYYFRHEYPPARLPTSLAIFGVVVGMIVFAIWVSPQAMFHAAPRTEGGFDPTRLLGAGPAAEGGGALYWASVAMRFVRLVAVVPVVEELFWRAFLLRYLLRENFLSVPFGTWTPLSFGVVTVGFMLEHHPADYAAALITGLLYNLVAIRTRSLPACVAAHAVTNALLGGYVMYTHQWGFW